MLKKIIITVVCLSTCLGTLAGCKVKEEGADTSDTTQTDTVQTDTVNVFASTDTEFTVIYPDKEESYYSPLVRSFISSVSTATGVTLSARSDFEKGASAPISNDEYEILIGATNRTESQNAACPDGKYMIKADGKKLVITGESRFYVALAMEYFTSSLLGNAENGKLFDISENYCETTAVKNAASTYVDMGDKISDELSWEKVAYFGALDGGELNVMQGGCTDGEYFYLLLNDGDDKTENSKSRIIKVDPETFKVVKTGPVIYVRHANDMTYNSKTGKLIISWCSVDSKSYSVVDIDTLDVSSKKTVAGVVGFYAIDYCAELDKYVIGESTNGNNEYRLQVLTGKLHYSGEPFDSLKTGYTKQGIHCDSKYIYMAQSPSSKSDNNNIIAVFDWEGNHVRTFTVDLPGESENIFWYNGNLYSAYNSNADGAQKLSLYRLTFNFTE